MELTYDLFIGLSDCITIAPWFEAFPGYVANWLGAMQRFTYCFQDAGQTSDPKYTPNFVAFMHE